MVSSGKQMTSSTTKKSSTMNKSTSVTKRPSEGHVYKFVKMIGGKNYQFPKIINDSVSLKVKIVLEDLTTGKQITHAGVCERAPSYWTGEPGAYNEFTIIDSLEGKKNVQMAAGRTHGSKYRVQERKFGKESSYVLTIF